jgi:hypothetical protein
MSWLTPLAQAWLVAVNVGIGLPLGAIAILMIHTLTGGLWGREARPALRAIAGLLPLMLLLGLPLIATTQLILPFLSQAPETLPPRVVAKLAYLQPGWIIVRTAVVAGLWLLAWRMAEHSRPGAVIGLIFYMLGLTVFTTDWGQALDPSYYSTMYPVEIAGAQILAAFALVVLLVPQDARGDFGNLLLTTILAWSYFAAMQWLISWMGNLPDEAAYYLKRIDGWWGALLALACLLFAIVPFLMLLRERLRRDLPKLRTVGWIVLGGYVLETVWRLAPAFAPNPLTAIALLLLAAVVYAALGRPPREARLV